MSSKSPTKTTIEVFLKKDHPTLAEYQEICPDVSPEQACQLRVEDDEEDVKKDITIEEITQPGARYKQFVVGVPILPVGKQKDECPENKIVTVWMQAIKDVVALVLYDMNFGLALVGFYDVGSGSPINDIIIPPGVSYTKYTSPYGNFYEATLSNMAIILGRVAVFSKLVRGTFNGQPTYQNVPLNISQFVVNNASIVFFTVNWYSEFVSELNNNQAQSNHYELLSNTFSMTDPEPMSGWPCCDPGIEECPGGVCIADYVYGELFDSTGGSGAPGFFEADIDRSVQLDLTCNPGFSSVWGWKKERHRIVFQNINAVPILYDSMLFLFPTGDGVELGIEKWSCEGKVNVISPRAISSTGSVIGFNQLSSLYRSSVPGDGYLFGGESTSLGMSEFAFYVSFTSGGGWSIYSHTLLSMKAYLVYAGMGWQTMGDEFTMLQTSNSEIKGTRRSFNSVYSFSQNYKLESAGDSIPYLFGSLVDLSGPFSDLVPTSLFQLPNISDLNVEGGDKTFWGLFHSDPVIIASEFDVLIASVPCPAFYCRVVKTTNENYNPLTTSGGGSECGYMSVNVGYPSMKEYGLIIQQGSVGQGNRVVSRENPFSQQNLTYGYMAVQTDSKKFEGYVEGLQNYWAYQQLYAEPEYFNCCFVESQESIKNYMPGGDMTVTEDLSSQAEISEGTNLTYGPTLVLKDRVLALTLEETFDGSLVDINESVSVLSQYHGYEATMNLSTKLSGAYNIGTALTFWMEQVAASMILQVMSRDPSEETKSFWLQRMVLGASSSLIDKYIYWMVS